MALYPVKKKKLWVIKAVDRATGRTVAWVLGRRDAATVRKLYAKIKHLNCTIYTDDWDAFAMVFPTARHVIGKSGTVAIERDNSNTRHHLGRFTRRTKVVSRNPAKVETALKIWCAMTNPDSFKNYHATALSIFR
jgi:insertion element IS1 protein InsB